MKTDFYTKAMLTIIAIALIALVFKDVDFVSKAQAESLSAPGINAVQQSGIYDVRIVGLDSQYSSWGLPVQIKE